LFAPLPAFAQKPKPPTAAEFDALFARVAKLESGAITTTDVVGTWVIVSRAISLQSNEPSWGEDFTNATFRVQNGGTGTATFTVAEHTLHLSVPATLERETSTAEGQFTWVLDNGRLVMTFPDGDQLGAFIGAGGRSLLIGGTGTNGPDGSWSDFWTGIKLPN
jgi:hypothetical protein